MQTTKKTKVGSSFFGTVFAATPQQLFDLLPAPIYNDNNGKDKVNFEWILETHSGNLFTIYDYKEYRKIDLDEVIEWHIGGFDPEYTTEALNEINGLLNTSKSSQFEILSPVLLNTLPTKCREVPKTANNPRQLERALMLIIWFTLNW